MIEPIVKAFDALLSDFSWRRLTAIVVFTAYVVIICSAYEAFTGHFRLARIEHSARVLAKLQDIDSRPLNPSSPIAAIRDDLVTKLREISNPSTVSLPAFAGTWRFLASSGPWLLLSLMFVSGIRKGQAGAWSGFVGILFFGIIAGFTGLLIPTFLWPWGNLVLYPIVLFVLFSVGAVVWENRKKKRLLEEAVRTTVQKGVSL